MAEKSVKELVIDGLLTDGAHHKQWYLEQILIGLGYDLAEVRKELIEQDYHRDYAYMGPYAAAWEDGIAP